MKTSILLAILFASLTSYAKGRFTPVAPERVEAIKSATLDALKGRTMKCVGIYKNGDGTEQQIVPNMDGINLIIADANVVEVNADGAQPILLLTQKRSPNDLTVVSKVLVTTDAEQKKVLKLQVDEAASKLERRNVGTITNPDFQDVPVVVESLTGTCE